MHRRPSFPRAPGWILLLLCTLTLRLALSRRPSSPAHSASPVLNSTRLVSTTTRCPNGRIDLISSPDLQFVRCSELTSPSSASAVSSAKTRSAYALGILLSVPLRSSLLISYSLLFRERIWSYPLDPTLPSRAPTGKRSSTLGQSSALA